ncbi:hypothetical protein EVAR_93667_1 [Eumeta japonica]|uniref:Uncharacterized protein n=1 Tax=Eumeta variegata TaxID=151549 RepID=A0A4C1TQN3_EUMVA|nr:hypothetical protein EVAR_93667_1 [Eumeta japonica]
MPFLDSIAGPALDYIPFLDSSPGAILDSIAGPALDYVPTLFSIPSWCHSRFYRWSRSRLCPDPFLDSGPGAILDSIAGPALDSDPNPFFDSGPGAILDSIAGPALDSDPNPFLDFDPDFAFDSMSGSFGVPEFRWSTSLSIIPLPPSSNNRKRTNDSGFASIHGRR